uniref:Uncharacterized protein n=1 Tax=Rhizophora mucronata TaxID=61149 RepID=A0A2P2P8L9_RHIMU
MHCNNVRPRRTWPRNYPRDSDPVQRS